MLKRACRIKADNDVTDGLEKYKQSIQYYNCDCKIYCPFKIQNLQFPLTIHKVEVT